MFVGADRVARNGDVVNKIGTCAIAILARHYGIAFYVACPSSTFDAATLLYAANVVGTQNLIDAMRQAIAGALGLAVGQVNVKAKTAEKMGPVGEGLAMEARAVVMLCRSV